MIEPGTLIYLFHEKGSFLVPYQVRGSVSSHKGTMIFPENLSFGDVIKTNLGEPYYVLKPTLSDLMMKVKRRTTIIYPKEAGYILLELGICSGKKIIEIGSGSGSLTLLLSEMVGESGKIYSFERRPEHQEFAVKNLQRLGRFQNNVEFILKDPTVEGGFGMTDMDAIFVDVPAPWTLIAHAHEALTGGGHIGVLSPNIEQIQTTVEKMQEVGFTRIRCQEVWERGLRIKKMLTRPFDRMIGHTGYLLFAQKVNKGQMDKPIDYSI